MQSAVGSPAASESKKLLHVSKAGTHGGGEGATTGLADIGLLSPGVGVTLGEAALGEGTKGAGTHWPGSKRPQTAASGGKATHTSPGVGHVVLHTTGPGRMSISPARVHSMPARALKLSSSMQFVHGVGQGAHSPSGASKTAQNVSLATEHGKKHVALGHVPLACESGTVVQSAPARNSTVSKTTLQLSSVGTHGPGGGGGVPPLWTRTRIPKISASTPKIAPSQKQHRPKKPPRRRRWCQ